MTRHAAAALMAGLALATLAAGCGPEAISDDERPQPFEGKAVAIGANGSVLVPGVRGPVGDRGCEQSLAVARLDAEGRTTGRAGVAQGSIDDSCRPQVDRVVSDRQGRLLIYGKSFLTLRGQLRERGLPTEGRRPARARGARGRS